jgi:hypothetical protein
MENCLDVVGLDLWFKLIQRRSRDSIRWYSIPKENCVREEAEFEVVSGCAEGFVSKTMIMSCEWCLRRDIEVWIDGNQIVCNFA